MIVWIIWLLGEFPGYFWWFGHSNEFGYSWKFYEYIALVMDYTELNNTTTMRRNKFCNCNSIDRTLWITVEFWNQMVNNSKTVILSTCMEVILLWLEITILITLESGSMDSCCGWLNFLAISGGLGIQTNLVTVENSKST